MDVEKTDAVSNEDDRNSVKTVVSSVLITIRGSFLAFVVTVGVVMILLSLVLSGYVLSGFSNGTLAAMTFIWGISAFVYAILGHIGLKAIGYH